MEAKFEVVPVSSDGHSSLFRVSGQLDARSAGSLLEACSPCCQPGGVLVLNLQGIHFLSSSGIGALLALDEDFRRCDASLRLSCLSPVVRSAIELLNLDQYLDLRIDDEDALRKAA
jgi:anti-anti-sigma factor